MSAAPTPAVEIGRAFAFRAEQLRDRVYDYYEQPAYFHELATEVPCVLIGGRGTGKTTVLKGLSYEGQRRLRPDDPPEEWPHYGVYLRFHTAHAGAFAGDELKEATWQKLFGHFINLTLCQAALEFCVWFRAQTGCPQLLSRDTLVGVAEMLGAFDEHPTDEASLRDLVGRLKRRFQNQVNTVADKAPPAPSAVGDGVDELLHALMGHPAMREKLFFFLLDEFETLNPSQQEVINTLIKHAGEDYTFKIGVKELGWRRKTVLGSGEQLQAPADYRAINIRERLIKGGFHQYGTRICQDRLDAVAETLGIETLPLTELLPQLSEDDEAALLGVGAAAERVRGKLEQEGAGTDLLAAFDSRPPMFQHLIGVWAEHKERSLQEAVQDSVARPEEWENRYGNYKYALLFTLRRHKRGIRKHYSGLDTYFGLADTNIRFLVQLVEEALQRHRRKSPTKWPQTPVPPKVQTEAAIEVGHRNLVELAGLSLVGPRLARLCASLGRIFQQMAWDPIGHAPEVTQFHLPDLLGDPFDDRDPSGDAEAPNGLSPRDLLAEAITHLVLIALPSTKLSETYLREYDYMVHPIFAPVFSFSYRKKRKMMLNSIELTELVDRPRATMRAILDRSDRELLDEAGAYPDQMNLLDRYLRDEP